MNGWMNRIGRRFADLVDEQTFPTNTQNDQDDDDDGVSAWSGLIKVGDFF